MAYGKWDLPYLQRRILKTALTAKTRFFYIVLFSELFDWIGAVDYCIAEPQ